MAVPGHALVQSQFSLISTGTELSLYGGEFPPNSVWARMARYPFTPGYANVGLVQESGQGWIPVGLDPALRIVDPIGP